MAIDRDLLATGHRLLATGAGLLATGRRLLATGHLRAGRGLVFPARGVLGGHRAWPPLPASRLHGRVDDLKSVEQPLTAPLLPVDPGRDRRRPGRAGLRAAGVLHRLVDDLAAGLRAGLVAVAFLVEPRELGDPRLDVLAGPGGRLLQQIGVDPVDLPAEPVGPLHPHQCPRSDRIASSARS